MAYLEEQEWIILNEINYDVSSIYNINDMYHYIFDWLGLLISYDCGMFSLIKKSTKQYNAKYELETVSARNIPEKNVKIWLSEAKRSDTTNLIIYSARETAYKVSDFMSDDKKKESSMYKLFYKPLELFYAMGMCIVFNGEPIGMIQLYRRKEQEDFCDRDIFILNQMQKHIAYRMYYEAKKGNVNYLYAEAYQEQMYKKYDFTEKERLIFDYAVEGLTNEEIANEMNISIHTVKKHFHSIYSKMNVTNRIQLLQGIPQKNNDGL